MLPSTGYFKGMNCPFYDSGLCERPYCHFRHVKKDTQSSANDRIESGAILKLVSAAVEKVLKQTEVSGSVTSTQYTAVDGNADINKAGVSQTTSKATYNPTPISELNKINSSDTENNDDTNEQRKRHIPVPYTPRKPASLPIKRPIDTNGSSKPFIYIPPPIKYTPGSSESVPVDTYTPTGSKQSNEKYLPGVEKERQEYTPDETSTNVNNKRNYIPSDKTSQKKKILEYKPIKVNPKTDGSLVTYQPTPKELVPCFSSDDEEPTPKKTKVASDLNGLDDLGPEFDILDQILDEEKLDEDTKGKTKKDKSDKSIKSKHSKENKQSNSGNTKSEEVPSKSSKSQKSKDKKTSERNEKSSSSRERKKEEGKQKDSDKKSSHKSSSRDRERNKKDKHSNDSKKHSSSKSSERSTKHSRSSSKKSDKSSDHSSSKHNSKTKSKHRKSDKKDKDSKKSKSKSKESNNMSDNDDNNVGEMEVEEVYTSESDEEAIALECKKIFEEYVPTVKTKVEEDTVKVEDTVEEEYVPGKKRISRTSEQNIKVTPKAPLKPNYRVSAAQAMADRLAKVKVYHASRNSLSTADHTPKPDPPKIPLSAPPTTGNSKIRIAHVPYASTLLNAKKTIAPGQETVKNMPSTSTTIVQTIRKGTQRVAHIPSEKFIDRPGVLEPLASKIPANIRSTYLNMMIDECLKLYLTATDAYARAQHEELATSKKCSTVQIYKNSAVLAVSRLRKELQECNGVKKTGSECAALQKIPGTVSGNSGNAGSWSIESKNRKVFDNSKEFSGPKFYKNIEKWILTEDQLKENGFPRLHASGEKGRAIIYGQNKQNPPKGYIRNCRRCKKDYTVDKKGFPAINEECIYHPNNKYRVRGEARYQCCSQDGTSDGCCIAPTHVYEYVDYENLKGYVKTLPPETIRDDYGVYSLDCEMCYTTQGLDLTRVTVINSSCKVVYETLIRPFHPIIDYNTRYSGITEEHMAAVKTTLLEVQATLLTMFNSKTILIGHSLESDFKALKLIHDTVIDTSVLYPHKMGPPFKRALRNLSSEYLKKIIQNSVDGHDSAEDATVCMELIHFRLKEELKTR